MCFIHHVAGVRTGNEINIKSVSNCKCNLQFSIRVKSNMDNQFNMLLSELEKDDVFEHNRNTDRPIVYDRCMNFIIPLLQSTAGVLVALPLLDAIKLLFDSFIQGRCSRPSTSFLFTVCCSVLVLLVLSTVLMLQ